MVHSHLRTNKDVQTHESSNHAALVNIFTCVALHHSGLGVCIVLTASAAQLTFYQLASLHVHSVLLYPPIISHLNYPQTSSAHSPTPEMAALLVCPVRFFILGRKSPPRSGDGCFAKVWISPLEFLPMFMRRGTCCQIEHWAAGVLPRFTCQRRGCGKIEMWIKAETCPDCRAFIRPRISSSAITFDQPGKLLLTWAPALFLDSHSHNPASRINTLMLILNPAVCSRSSTSHTCTHTRLWMVNTFARHSHSYSSAF